MFSLMDFQNEGPHYFYQEVIISSEDLKKKKKRKPVDNIFQQACRRGGFIPWVI